MRGKTEYIGDYKIRNVYTSPEYVGMKPLRQTSRRGYRFLPPHYWAITLNGNHIDSALTKHVAMQRARRYANG